MDKNELTNYIEALEEKYEKMDNLVRKVSRSRNLDVTKYWVRVSKRVYNFGKKAYEEENFERSKALIESADAILDGATEVFLRGGV